ncbi:CRISPR-associated protein Cas5 [Spirochaetia bacterium 38H-sp]|uniref:CRISPR-associated protein Cas5 n=1 Tax=Rarispira pelagica TaxID=3141764 RepID=A0ABU9UBD8_9SPIR
MKALMLKLYQTLCNYRKEGSFGYVQTYPLPTPSMIRGMVHEIMEFTEYKPLKISIQGKSDAVITNIQKVFKFDRDSNSRPDNPYKITVGKATKTATHGILFIDLHVNMQLIIHISFREDNEKMLNELYKKIQEKIVVLGRNEDFALVEDLKIVGLNNYSGRSANTQFPMYVMENSLIEKCGTRYRLPFYYDTVESFEENRVFHFVEPYYVGKDVPLKKDSILQDEENNIVCLLEVD